MIKPSHPIHYVIDREGYRPNVGIIVCNGACQVLWARRARHDGWQFPQGGVERNETAEEAAYRELYEEVGLRPGHVQLVGHTSEWLHYDVPHRHARQHFRGQKQLWFLFCLLGDDSDVRLNVSPSPEFDSWRWVSYWDPVEAIVSFKRQVYRLALQELEPLLGDIAGLSARPL